MDLLSVDLINWTNYFKGNYRKGAARLRAILDEPTLYARFKSDLSAMNAVIANYDKSSIGMMQMVYDSGLGDDLAAAYAVAAGYETVENLTSNGPTLVRHNISLMSDALMEAVYQDVEMISFVATTPTNTVPRIVDHITSTEQGFAIFAGSKTYLLSLMSNPDSLDAFISNEHIWAGLASASPIVAADPSAFSGFVGKQIDIAVTSYGTFAFTIIGVGHDTLVAGGTAGFTFQSKDIVLKSSSRSTLHTWLDSTFLPKLPTKVKNVIAPVVKTVCSSSSVLSTENHSVWSLSAYEVTGLTTQELRTGDQYQWYKDGNSPSKIYGTNTLNWWLRSVNTTGYPLIIASNGDLTSTTWDQNIGVAPAFCV